MKPKLLLALVLSLTLGIAGIANGALITSVDTTQWLFAGAGITNLYFQNSLDPSASYTWNSASLTINGFSLDQNNNVISVQDTTVLGNFNSVYSYTNTRGLNQFFMVSEDPSNGGFKVGFAIQNTDARYAITSSNLSVDYTDNGVPGHLANPEPGTMVLLGSGLLGLAVWGRKKIRS